MFQEIRTETLGQNVHHGGEQKNNLEAWLPQVGLNTPLKITRSVWMKLTGG